MPGGKQSDIRAVSLLVKIKHLVRQGGKAMKKFYIVFFTVALGLVIAVGDFTFVNAQGSQTDEFTLEEITVTAQKREEDLQKVAIAVEAISGEDLKELGKVNLNDALSTISSVFLNKTSDGWQVSARGLSNDLPPGESSPQTVSVNKDGVYTYRKDAGLTGFYDIERVEVLLGPQSTLYSSNTPGGVVNIITSDPKLDMYEASGTLNYGNYGHLYTEGMMNVPISDYMALRAAFSTTVHDGYLSNGQDDEDTKSMRIKFKFQPNDDFSIVQTLEYTDLGGKGFGTVPAFGDEGELDDPWYTPNSGDTVKEVTTKKYYGRIDWSLGFADLAIMPSVTANDQYNESTSERFGFRINEGWNNERVFEARLVSPSGSRIDWILGLYWHETEWFSGLGGDDGPGSGNYETMTHYMQSEAAYGNVTYPFTDRFRLTGGARITSETFDAHQKFETPPQLPPGMIILFDWVWEDTNPDYKFGFEYDLTQDSMLWAHYTTSIRSDARGNTTEHLNATQVGSKNRFLDDRFQMNASAFLYDYTNYIAIDRRSDPEFPRVNQTPGPSNGDVKLYGMDISTSYLISQSDTLNVSASLLKSEFTRLLFKYVTLPWIDYKGEPLTNSPTLSIAATYSHEYYLENGGSVTARLDTRYQTEQYVNFTSQDPVSRVEPSHSLTNLSAIYRSPGGKFSFTGYIKNIENHAEKRRLSNEEIGIGPPRTYGVIFTVRH
jgi:iron complex outermembrane receptor protein